MEGEEWKMGNRQWEYLVGLARDMGNMVLAVLVIGQFVLEKGIDPSLFLWGIGISIGAYVAGFLLTFLVNEE
jgi:hypothetical protein